MHSELDYYSLCREYTEISKAYSAMPEAQRTASDALKMIDRMKDINRQLVAYDASVGRWHRPIGNYKSKFHK